MGRISRRELLGGALGTAVLACLGQGQEGAEGARETPTRYIAAYDTESPACLAACRKIVAVHKQLEMPATFFITGKTLEANAKEYRALLTDPLFEVASHTWSHKLLCDNAMCGPAVSPEEKREEIFRAKALIESVFERPCVGLRPAVGFDRGFHGAVDVLTLVREAGFHYGADGFTDIWELPGHGWHENLLKDHNRWGARRLTLWPSPMPEGIPTKFVKTPHDEFEVNRVFLEKALETGKPHLSLIWHPWSLHAFDPEMKMLELTFAHARRLGLVPCTYAELCRHVTN